MFKSVSMGGRGAAEAVVVGVFKGAKLDGTTAGRDVGSAAAEAIGRPEFTGEVGSVVEGFNQGTKRGSRGGGSTRVLVVGLGAKEKFEAGMLRNAAGAAGRRLAAAKATSVEIDLAGPVGSARVDHEDAGQAFGEGLGLVGWNCDQFKGTANAAPARPALKVRAEHKAFSAGLERGLALAESANLCRTLSQTPPNVATPAFMAEQARKLARQTGLKCTVLSGKDLERETMTGLINVGKASENGPCLIRLEYTPGGAGRGRARASTRSKPIVLVGKTMTYDTGGLSLKINNTMVGMKRDKDGGCAVLGAMHAVATAIRPRRRVVALLAAAENSISDEAYRPDDVLRYRNGVTVEVTNTDAEGRLVLADALCWACEKENPASIIDLATLTGGVVVALGSTYCGMFCEDEGLRKKIEAASASSGERVWQLPMHQEYRDMMKSPIADILNSNPNRKAHPIQGAAFLSYFVEEGIPWCHLDIAGVHAVESAYGPFEAGPTGWGTRLLAHMLDGE